MPALSRDGVSLDSGPVKLGNGLGKPESSDTAVMEEELRLGNLSVDPGYSSGTKDLWWCARFLGGQADGMSSEETEARLGLCANAKYLLIVRILETTYPKVDEGKGTFQAGSALGEVRVFNLGSSKDLGGFRKSAAE